MEPSINYSEGKATIQLFGRFDVGAHRAVRAAADSALGQPDLREIAIDLGSVEYLDSAALGLLLVLRERARLHGCAKVSLARCQRAVERLLHAASYDRLFYLS